MLEPFSQLKNNMTIYVFCKDIITLTYYSKGGPSKYMHIYIYTYDI